MSLTDEEIEELERLIEERRVSEHFKTLSSPVERGANKNYAFLKESMESQEYEDGKLVSGYRGVILEGSSRSGKTFSGVDFIIYLCCEVEDSCTINIVRETYAEFKETLYDDFRNRLDDYNLHNPFHYAKEVKSFRIKGSTIRFIGSDKIGKKHGAGCDYLFFNEMIHIDRQVFDQLEMRCRKFWWGDYNPSVTEHYIFNNILKRPDIGFLRTTFRDNDFISIPEKNKILGYEPWESGSYDIIGHELFYNGKVIDEKNQPPGNNDNISNGTADPFMWKVYGLGLRGAMRGVVFPIVNYIDEFPDLAYTYGLDFGFTNDPTALVRYAEDKEDIFIELLIYQPIDNPSDINDLFNKLWIEDDLPITADSSDKYVSEKKGAVEMVRSLRDMGWPISKVSKTKNIMFWLSSMKSRRINVVRSKDKYNGRYLFEYLKTEFENYRFKEINGIAINQPIDGFDHGISAARYAHMSYRNNDFDVLWH